MKIKRKGKKVHPSPPQTTVTTPPSPSTIHDSLSVLNLLPAAIFSLIAALSFQDREVLAYMITRSLKTTTTSSINSPSPSVVQEELKLNLKKIYSLHKSPVFDCDCFECYTSFWFRWDSSANREVIHQAIEAFEEHLSSSELVMKQNRKSKKKDKLPLPLHVQFIEAPNPAVVNEETVPVKNMEVNPMPTKLDGEEVVAAAAEGAHKGFARKVIPDVLGVLNSRLWNLWGPNV